jgi:CxxC motif-containing protein (DUF1111 family)
MLDVAPRSPRIAGPSNDKGVLVLGKQKICSVLTAVVFLSGAAIAAQMGAAPFKKRHKLPPSPSTAAVLNKQRAAASPAFGAALAELDASSRSDFEEGQSEFSAVETPDGGLGPIFNDSSCAACHTAGGIGGASETSVTRYGRLVGGKFDDLAALGGSLLQARAIDPAALEKVPAEASIVVKRITTPLFGAGLIEAIADETIELNARRSHHDGVRGRVSRVLDVASGTLRVGRFGWKAQQATLLAFAGDAYLNEMGVTSRLFPTENAPNGRADLLVKFDLVPDIEDSVDAATGKGDIDHAADFMRLLAPPPQVRPTADALAGARVFEKAACSACHTPMMYTGIHPVAALSQRPVRLYSDLLLHDMGRLGDGIEQGDAKMREMRTAPLWGLRVRTALLHDGRARSVAEAITQHDGAAAASRRRFEALSAQEQGQLLEFLKTI